MGKTKLVIGLDMRLKNLTHVTQKTVSTFVNVRSQSVRTIQTVSILAKQNVNLKTDLTDLTIQNEILSQNHQANI